MRSPSRLSGSARQQFGTKLARRRGKAAGGYVRLVPFTPDYRCQGSSGVDTLGQALHCNPQPGHNQRQSPPKATSGPRYFPVRNAQCAHYMTLIRRSQIILEVL